MDRFAALQSFVAVAENGGFAPAARRIGVAPSSLTRQVDTLEERLGVRLFNRSTRTVTLTAAGMRYLEDARRILDELETAERGVTEEGVKPRGTLRVSAPVAFARLHIAPLLAPLLRSYPDLSVEIVATDSIVDLVEDNVDVAVRLGALPMSSLVVRRLGPHVRVVCGSPDYFGERGTPAVPSDLSEHNCLIFDYQAGPDEWRFCKEDSDERVRVRGTLKARGSEILREAAIGGVGIILMPTWLVGADIAAGRLVRILADWTAGRTAGEDMISAVYLPNRRGSVKVRCFVDMLTKAIGNPPVWDASSSGVGASSDDMRKEKR
jgi:DNA-binding transcriptional LysR family regulator